MRDADTFYNRFKRSPPAHGSVTDDLAGLNTDGE